MRVVLFGYLGGQNLGDDAMLAGLLETIPTGWDVVVLARDPAAVRVAEGLACSVAVRPASLRSAVGALRGADVVARVGGTSFHDEYVGERGRRMWTKYVRLGALFVVPRALGVQVVALGIGSGRIRRRSTRLLASVALRSCSLVLARDRASAEGLRRLAGRREVVAGADLAWLTAPSAPRDAGADGDPGDGIDVLGVSVLDLEPYVDDAGAADRVWEELATFVLDHPFERVALFAFRDNEVESDVPVAEAMAGRLRAKGVAVEVWVHGDGLDAVLAAINRCDAFVATRYHAAVFAARAGVPLAVLPYNSKLEHFAEDTALPPGALLDLADWSRPAAGPRLVTFGLASAPEAAVAVTRVRLDALWREVA